MLFERVHDVVDLVRIIDLDAVRVNLHLDAPEPKGLSLRLALLEEDINCVINCLRNSEQLEPFPHSVLLLQLLVEYMRIIEEIYLEIILVEESDQIRSGKLGILDMILQSE